MLSTGIKVIEVILAGTCCLALTLEILIIFYVWFGQGVTRVGKSMFSIS